MHYEKDTKIDINTEAHDRGKKFKIKHSLQHSMHLFLKKNMEYWNERINNRTA